MPSLPFFPASSPLTPSICCHFLIHDVSWPLEAGRGEVMFSSSYSQWEENLPRAIDSSVLSALLLSPHPPLHLSYCGSLQSCSNLYTLAALPPAPVRRMIASVWHVPAKGCEKEAEDYISSQMCEEERRGEKRKRGERRGIRKMLVLRKFKA